MSDAKTVEAETKMQAEDLAKAEASVLIISISTKTRIGLFPLLGNKNLCPPRNIFRGPDSDRSEPPLPPIVPRPATVPSDFLPGREDWRNRETRVRTERVHCTRGFTKDR